MFAISLFPLQAFVYLVLASGSSLLHNSGRKHADRLELRDFPFIIPADYSQLVTWAEILSANYNTPSSHMTD